jgi:hypothetical protein
MRDGEGAIDARALAGRADVLLLTLDTLRYDVARDAMASGLTPRLEAAFGGWEERHSPASFTFAAHAAFFAGFLPTPIAPGVHERLFAVAFPGSETIGPRTCVFDAPDIVSGFKARGYRTICVGGTGFFNPASALGRVLPGLFDESCFGPELGVANRDSTRHQVARAIERVGATTERVFLFVNVSAIHEPNRIYVEGAARDSIETHRAALAYVDGELDPLFAALRKRGPVLAIACSDHGTAYGEDGYTGHRIGHPIVWTVPYAEAVWTPL